MAAIPGQVAGRAQPRLSARLRLLQMLYRMRWLWHFLRATSAFIVLLAIWALVVVVARPSEGILPPPQAIVSALGDLIEKGILADYLSDSLIHLSVASLGILLAVPLGWGIALNRHIASFFYPLLNFFQSLSGIALLPLLMVWIGFNERTILVAINYTVIFPVIFSTLIGVRTIPQTYKNAVLTMGGSQWRIIKDVVLPGSLPNVVSGMRMGIAYGWRALIGAEMLVAADGLGYMIFAAQTHHFTSRIMLGMIIIGLLWMFIERFGLRPIEALTIDRWGLVQR